METKNIQDFLALAELGSSYAAAEKLFVSQSTLVRHIQSFEEEFGVTLFDRTRTGFVLNEAGNLFLPYAKKIALTQKQCQMALHHEDEDSMTVRICSVHKIIDLIMDFKKAYPQYSIDFKNPLHADMQLREGLLDVAFVPGIEDTEDEMVVVPYVDVRMLVMVYDGHPFANRESVSLEELRNETFVAMANDELFNEAFQDYFVKEDFVPNVAISAPTGSDIMELVKEGFGISLIHGLPQAVPEREGLRIVDIVPHIHSNICMCYRNHAHPSQATKDFVEFARKRQIKHQKTNLTFL